MRDMHMLALVLSGAFGVCGSVTADEDAYELIKRQLPEFSDASASRDIKVLNKYLDDDIIFMQEIGVLATKKDVLANTSLPSDGFSA